MSRRALVVAAPGWPDGDPARLQADILSESGHSLDIAAPLVSERYGPDPAATRSPVPLPPGVEPAVGPELTRITGGTTGVSPGAAAAEHVRATRGSAS